MTKSKSPTTHELNKKIEANAEETKEQIDGIKESNAKILEMLEGMTAQNHPSGSSTQVQSDANNTDLGTQLVTAKQDDGGDVELITDNIPDIESPFFKAKAENLAFDQELVQIRIHDTSDKDADPAFILSINGEKEVFVRGGVKTVKRMFVGALCSAKPVHYGNEEYEDFTGVGVRHPARRGLRYAFDVLKDDNPKGAAWLESRLRAA